MHPEEVAKLVQRAFPNAEVHVNDLTGGEDHFNIVVVSPLFQGKTLIDQHRMVQRALQAALGDGRIHAVQIKTSTQKDFHTTRSDDRDFTIVA